MIQQKYNETNTVHTIIKMKHTNIIIREHRNNDAILCLVTYPHPQRKCGVVATHFTTNNEIIQRSKSKASH